MTSENHHDGDIGPFQDVTSVGSPPSVSLAPVQDPTPFAPLWTPVRPGAVTWRSR